MIKIVSIPSTAKPQVEEFVLVSGKEYSIGRKQQDISLHKDTSISRNHATIQVDHPLANVTNAALIPSLVITDLGSKFGTFINDGIEANRPASMREPNTLSSGDRFRFGLGPSTFKIHYTPLVATSSCIKSSTPLKQNICALGGHLVPEWTEKCDILVMETLTLTVKVVCALLSAKPIVTPAYFQDYFEAVQSKKSKAPKPEDYVPALAETSLPKGVSFFPEPRRTSLFRNKIFLFASAKQSKKIGVAIKCAGGSVDLIANKSQVVLRSPDTIIVSPSDDTVMTTEIRHAIEIYEKSQKRMIQESEIGLAAVYMSTDKHCNPSFNFKKRTVFPKVASQTQQFPVETQQIPVEEAVTIVGDSESASQPMQRTCPTQSFGDNAITVVGDSQSASQSTLRTDPTPSYSQGKMRHNRRLENDDEPSPKRIRQEGCSDNMSEERKVTIETDVDEKPFISSSDATTLSPSDDSVMTTKQSHSSVEILEEKRRSPVAEVVTIVDDSESASQPTLKTRPAQPQSQEVRHKRRLENVVEPSPKKVRQEDWTDITIGARKLKIGTDVDEKPLMPAPFAFAPLLVKREVYPLISKTGAKTVKNFKVFKKIQPLANSNANSMVADTSSSMSTRRSNATTMSFRRHIPCVVEPVVLVTNNPPVTNRSNDDDNDEIPDFAFD